MASVHDDKARAAGEAFMLLSQTIEDLTVPEVVTLAPREGTAPGPLLRMAVRSAIITLYRLKEIRDHFLVPWLFTDPELRTLGLPPVEELVDDWRSFVTVRGQYTGHVRSKNATSIRPGQMISPDALGRAARKAGIWDGPAFLRRTRSLVPKVRRVTNELARRHQHVLRFRNKYTRTVRETAEGRG
jgi:hypothetical protein